jgi:anti-sigma regulatory factor (Ser/Thr protein kinase)
MRDAGDEAAVLRISAAVEDLGRLYPWLDDAAAARNVPGATVRKMHVALEEAVANVAMHAYGPDADGEITIRLFASPDAAALVVEDAGPAFDPTSARPRPRAASIEEAEVGGLGLTLLRHFCRDISYERAGGRNRLTLRFPLAGG